MNQYQDPVSGARYVPCYNASGSTIPAFGVAVSSGSAADGQINLIRPTADGLQGCWVNGPTPLLAATYGICTNDLLARVAYDTGDGTPERWDVWGTVADSFLLRKGKPGFRCVGSGGEQSGSSLFIFSSFSVGNDAATPLRFDHITLEKFSAEDFDIAQSKPAQATVNSKGFTGQIDVVIDVECGAGGLTVTFGSLIYSRGLLKEFVTI